ncbi:hypothetical protein DPMN_047432 [Dreissena polymorpha]|uniref:Uncharacterized protein n=1 Tax=Dreissena polymorpha TaxID=45954 RepID=A0A9D4I1V5_DREPO|nr:hypothetical protein DPMN_047432 [Dreissena polymorpha]
MLECLQTKCGGRTDCGQRPILKHHLSNQFHDDKCSITKKTAPPPWQPYRITDRQNDRQTGQKQYTPDHSIRGHKNFFGRTDRLTEILTDGQFNCYMPPYRGHNKTNLFTKFHDDWANNVTSRFHVIQLTGTIFQLNSRIEETNVLTKFHQNWANNVTSRISHKNAPPTGGHVLSPIWTFFQLVRHINKTNVLINFHVFKRKTVPPTGGHVFQQTGTTFELNQHINWALHVTSIVFELDRDIIGLNLLTKFHEDRTINVASRVFTNKCGRTDGRRTDGRRTKTGHISSPEQSVGYNGFRYGNTELETATAQHRIDNNNATASSVANDDEEEDEEDDKDYD